VKDVEFNRSDHIDKSSFKISQTVTATDYRGSSLVVEASQTEVLNNPGIYEITYTATDDLDQVTEVKQKVTIKDDYPEKVAQGFIPLNEEYFDEKFEKFLENEFRQYVSGDFLDVSSIESISIYSHDFDTLDFKYFSNLKGLNLSLPNSIKKLSITDLPNLESVSISNNYVIQPDVIVMDNLPNLQYLSMSESRWSKDINIQAFKNLETIYLLNGQTGLTDLNLSNLQNLNRVCINDNYHLSTLVLGNNPNLQYLNVANNNISSLDLSTLSSLRVLDVSNNNLKTLDISHNKELPLNKVTIRKQATGFQLVK